MRQWLKRPSARERRSELLNGPRETETETHVQIESRALMRGDQP